jgi:tetratricopeptide (TPR) repeat protein
MCGLRLLQREGSGRKVLRKDRVEIGDSDAEEIIMLGKILGRTSGIISLTILFTLPAQTQDRWSWPEKPSNLQVLPKEWPGSRLRPVMTGFTRALGVRCSYCHKGEEGKPLSTYDFASDENPNKNRAREMLRMLGSINDHLKKIEPSGDKRVNMWCHTCHHGRPRPMTLEEELGEQYRTKGLKPALDYYADLKKKYYGRGAYDFGEGALNNFGYELLENKDAAGAIQVFKLNAEGFPQSGNVWDSLAEGYMKAGDLKKAEENYEKALTLDPTDENAKEMLKKIKESKEK